MAVEQALSAITAAIALVDKLRGVTTNMQLAEVRIAIADLNLQLADAKLLVAALKDEIVKLRAENAALQARNEARRPKVKWGCYLSEGDDNLYCPACFDTQGKKFLVTRFSSQKRVCSVCRAELYS